jgi:putative spermidine/putrescine transport system substrate-binding protein
MPWGPTGSVKNLAIPDWGAINAKRQALTDIWNRQVAGK